MIIHPDVIEWIAPNELEGETNVCRD
jgi:hypothetical protein